MTAISKVFAVVLLCVLVGSCTSDKVSILKGRNYRVEDCNPKSTNVDVLKKSQAACHVGVPGDLTQIKIEFERRTASFSGISGHSTFRKIISIYLALPIDKKSESPIPFSAFYSEGTGAFQGKTGCIGILKDGSAGVRREGESRVLDYHLKFELVSPLGWKDECGDRQSTNGSVVLGKI